MPTTEVRTGSLTYRVEGSGPPLILLHANLHDGRDYDAVVPALARDFRVHVVDWPGHGESAPLERPEDMSAALCADVLEDFVDALDLDGVALIGSSVGGFAAARLALRQPDRVTALVLVQSAGFMGTPAKVRLASRVLGSPRVQRSMAARLPHMYMSPSTPADREVVARVTRVARTPTGSAKSAAMWRSFARDESDLRDRAGDVTTPTLVVWGTRDRIRPLGEGEELARSIPGARLATLPTGHLPFVTDPEGFLEEVVPFLRDGAAARWRSPKLGASKRVRLSHGELEYFDRGEGPVLVFAHGWLANANLWREVVDRLAARFRCVTLDLPLGSHRRPLDAEADLTPDGCGTLIADAIDALGLDEVTLIGNDSGGAYSQIAVSRRPERIARLVLNSCETPYDEFPPPPFDGLPAVASDPRQLGELLAALGDPEVRTSEVAYGLLAKHPLERRASDSYVLPCQYDAGVLHDTSKAIAAAASSPVHAAGQLLIEAVDKPMLLIWSSEDSVFPLENARRYAAALPRARVEAIDDCYSFAAEDQPERLATVVETFASEPLTHF